MTLDTHHDQRLLGALYRPEQARQIEQRLDTQWARCLKGADSAAGEVREVIWQSWLRSRARGIASDTFDYRFVPADTLRTLLAAHAGLIETAAPIMEGLLAYNPHGHINLTDADGVTLHACGLDITPLGSLLREDVQGTNCTGLSLVENRLVYVLAEENYKQALRRRRMHCAAAPIRDPAGRTLGSLTLTAEVGNFHFHTLGTVQAAAEAVGRQLALKALLDEQRTVLEVLNEGLVTLDAAGCVRAINRYARRLLNWHDDHLGRPFAELAGAEVATWLARDEPLLDRELALHLGEGATLRCLVSISPIGQGGWVLSLREPRRIRAITRQVLGTRASYRFAQIQGSSQAIQDCLRLAQVASRSDSTTLILGESGVGKELFAQAIHNASSRREGPFVALNCGAIPRDLVQSELFGYVEGAFSGAARGGAAGKFELADGGTLFLDEIGDMPLDAQASLLRVLQEGEVTRVGGKQALPVDVRVIAATHRDLAAAVVERSFRQDVFYRLNVLNLKIPALRERTGDVPVLAGYLLEKQARALGKALSGFTPEAMAKLCGHNWPGNVRELENVIERAANLAVGALIEAHDLPGDGASTPLAQKAAPASGLEAHTRELICQALAATGGNIRQAAQQLGVSRGGLYLRMNRLGLAPDQFR